MVFLLLFWTHWVKFFGDYNVFTCLTCFDHLLCVLHTFPYEWFVMHCSCISYAHHKYTWCTPQVHLMHTLYHLTCFVLHSCYVRLIRPLALKTWSCDLVCLSIFILGLFLFLFLWTNLNLIKFVTMFMHILFFFCFFFCFCMVVCFVDVSS